MKLVKIRKILKEEMKKALELVWKVFLEYEAPDYTEEGIKEFSKRLSRYCNLDIIEIDDEKAPENLSEKEMEIVKTKEGEKLFMKWLLYENGYVILFM